VILVIGANGFLGSWLVSILDKYKIDWHGLYKSNSDNKRLEYLSKARLTCLRSSDWVHFIQDSKPDIVVSCDWDGVANLSRNNKLLQFSNVNRVLELASISKQIGVKKFISFGSQAENGPINKLAMEINYDSPTTYYGRAKVETRKALEKSFTNSDTQLIWGRIFSTYGETDNRQWLIPSMVNNFMNRKIFELTSGEQEWSYLHAHDFSKAILKICESSINVGILNIGNPNTFKISEIASKIAKYMDASELLKIGNLQIRDDQVMYLKPSVVNLNSIGWEPTIELDDGLFHYIDWARGLENEFKGIKLTNFS
jgi:UDP-glucose 4-epimerase